MPSSTRLRVIYFTRVPVHNTISGGQLCCRNHIERLAADGTLDCTFVVAGPAENEAATLEYFRAIGVHGRFIRFAPPPYPPLPWITERWPYLDEIPARQQGSVDTEFYSLIVELCPACIVLDYLPSAYFVPSVFRSRVPVVTITLNREASFFEELRRRDIRAHAKPFTRVAGLRLRLAEAAIQQRSAAVVTIGKYDRPLFARSILMAPYLDPSPQPWVGGSRSLFFVGNRFHFPNHDAMEWLATRFAPELEALDPLLRLKLVGATAQDVPAAWHRPNIEFLGIGDNSTLQHLFRTEAAMIAPISNTYGAKFKVAEAISYGIPLLVPESAMSGVPYLPWLPRIDLQRPGEAATAAHALLSSDTRQREMSARILADARTFIGEQSGAWARTLRAAAGRRHITPPGSG